MYKTQTPFVTQSYATLILEALPDEKI